MSSIPYIRFGSVSSIDADILFPVEKLPCTIQGCKTMVQDLEREVKPMFSQKINGNLVVVANGVLVDVFKGLVDECNNSCLATYHLHRQAFAQPILYALPRDKGAKAVRTSRILLSLCSRGAYRIQVKEALHDDCQKQINLLSQKIDDILPTAEQKGMPLTDIYKSWAFQLAQMNALLDDVEIFTKEDAAELFPTLSPYLFRRKATPASTLINFARKTLSAMASLV